MLQVRDAQYADLDEVWSIYAHHVLHSLGTFEEIPPDMNEMIKRYDAIREKDLPWLVAVAEGKIVGMGYAGPFRPRSAYRFTVEDSVYVAPAATGQGVGKAILQELIAQCESLGLRQMMAVIGDSGNAASVALHASCGFTHQGVARAVGFKHGRWVDTLWMQRTLGAGNETLP